MSILQKLIRSIFVDEHGKIVLIQSPNLPLIVFAIASLLAIIWSKGSFHNTAKVIAFGSIFTWAWLETVSGVNYLRRILGIVVLILSIMSAVVLLQTN